MNCDLCIVVSFTVLLCNLMFYLSLLDFLYHFLSVTCGGSGGIGGIASTGECRDPRSNRNCAVECGV